MRGNRNLIPISALITIGTITFASLEETGELPSTAQWLGFVVSYFVIAALGDLGVPLAGGLAVLTMVAVLLERGGFALRYITSREGEAAKRSRRRRDSSRGRAPGRGPGTLESGPLEGSESATIMSRAVEPLQPLTGNNLEA